MVEKIAFFTGENLQHIPYLYSVAKHHEGNVWLTNSKNTRNVLNNDYNIKPFIYNDSHNFIKHLDDNKIKKIVYADFYNFNSPNVKTVQLFHGGVGDRYNPITLQTSDYDLLLRYGKRCEDKFRIAGHNLDKVKLVGYSRLDDYYNNNIKKLKLFNNDRKTILFAPTVFKDLKFNKWLNNVLNLVQDYNIVFKVHYLNSGIANQVDIFMKNNNVSEDNYLITTDYDILPYMEYCDMLISNNSGCIYEFLHFNKPIVIVNTHDLICRDNVMSLTYAWNYLPVANNAKELYNFVKSELLKDGYKDRRKELLDYSFSFKDGRCGLRAMKLILEK